MSSLNSEKLSHYFAGQDSGAAPSNFLEMCWATLAVSHTSAKCRDCRGLGFRELSAEELKVWTDRIAAQETAEHRQQVREALSRASTCPACRGSGHTIGRAHDRSAAMDSMYTTVRCNSCRGSGEVVDPTDTSAERQDVCLACGGAAYIVPVTARCGKQSHSGGGGSATDDAEVPLPASPTVHPALEQGDDRNRVTRDLEAIRIRDPQLADALASYHGPEAEPWVRHRWGKVFVLWQHTAAGKLLAAEAAELSPARSGYLVHPTKLLAAQRELLESRQGARNRTREDDRLRVLCGRADREARELQVRMFAVLKQIEDAA